MSQTLSEMYASAGGCERSDLSNNRQVVRITHYRNPQTSHHILTWNIQSTEEDGLDIQCIEEYYFLLADSSA